MLLSFMDRDIWNLIVSQGHSDDSEPLYRLAEKIVLHLGSIYEWPKTAIVTFAGLPCSLKHNKCGSTMGRFQFAVWAIGNGCPSALLKEWVTLRKLIRDPKDLASFCKLCDGLANGTVSDTREDESFDMTRRQGITVITQRMTGPIYFPEDYGT